MLFISTYYISCSHMLKILSAGTNWERSVQWMGTLLCSPYEFLERRKHFSARNLTASQKSNTTTVAHTSYKISNERLIFPLKCWHTEIKRMPEQCIIFINNIRQGKREVFWPSCPFFSWQPGGCLVGGQLSKEAWNRSIDNLWLQWLHTILRKKKVILMFWFFSKLCLFHNICIYPHLVNIYLL